MKRQLFFCFFMVILGVKLWNIYAAKARLTLYKAHKIHHQTPKKITQKQKPALLAMPLVRQSTNWTCGAAVLMSILDYFGIAFREDVMAQYLESNPDIGTSYKNIVEVATAQLKTLYPNATVIARNNMTLSDLENAINKGNPVQVAFQAWADNPSNVDYKTDNDDGHYSIVIGYDKDNFYFMDPSTIGNYTYIPKKEFADRWHDVDGITNQPVINFGIEFSAGGSFKRIYNPNVMVQFAMPEKYPHVVPTLSTKPLSSSLLLVPKTRQSTNWNSALATLQSVLYYFGVEFRQDRLAKSLNIDSDILKQSQFIDIAYDTIVNFSLLELKKNNQQAVVQAQKNMTIAELQKAIDAKKPVIVVLNPWSDASTNEDDGRYALVIGYDNEFVIMMSPSILGNYAYCQKAEFEKRWQKVGIVYSNGKKDNAPAFNPSALPKLE